jgi:hypothetical protein
MPNPALDPMTNTSPDIFDTFHQLDQPSVPIRLAGVNPTPQLPITVVTPYQDTTRHRIPSPDRRNECAYRQSRV